MKQIRCLILLFILLHTQTFALVTDYYAKASGNILLLSTWGINTDGSGTAPASFNINDVRFHFRNRSSFNLNLIGSFLLNGANTTIIIGDGTTIMSFYLPTGYSLKSDSVFFQNNTNTQITGNLNCQKPAFAFNSSINYTDTASLQPIVPGNYGKLYLTIGGSKKLKGNVQVRNFCSIQDKLLICDSFSLTIGESVAQPGSLSFGNTSNLGAMVVGKIRRWIPAGTISSSQGYFPLGNGIKFLPITITNSSTTSGGLVSAEFLPNQTGIYGLPIIDSSYTPFVNVNRIDAIGSWRITEESSVSGSNFFVYVKPLNLGNILWEGALRLLKKDLTSGVWGKPGTSSGVCCSAYEPSFGRTGLPYVQGDYAIGSDSIINVLPVQLLSISGNWVQDQIELKWVSAQEKNSKEYLIESFEEKGWKLLGKVNAAGNSHIQQAYTFVFEPEDEKKEFILKLSCLDQDGKLEEKSRLIVKREITDEDYIIAPNPFSQSIMVQQVKPTIDEPITLQLFNSMGSCVYESVWESKINPSMSIQSQFLPAGTYYLKIKQGQNIHNYQLLKQ